VAIIDSEVTDTPKAVGDSLEPRVERAPNPKENKGFFYWLRSMWEKMMHDGRETTHSIKVRVKRIRKNLSRRNLRSIDGTMSSPQPVEGVEPGVVTRHRTAEPGGELDPIEYGPVEKLPKSAKRARRHRLRNVMRASKELRQRHKEFVEVERTQKDFPFFKYFVSSRPVEKPKYRPDWRQWKNDELTMAWIGHSTVLINFFGTWILTDPIFSSRSGINLLGVFTIGVKRVVEPALSIDDLPKIDLLLVSHSHMDHTDFRSLKQLRNARHLFVPRNTADIFQSLKIVDLQELDLGDRVKLDDRDVVVEAVEVKHFGWRYPWEPCRGRNEEGGRSFNAFMVETTDPSGRLRSIVFAGDTAYTESFKKLGDRLRNEDRTVDVAIMPIGAYEPWIGAHCNPEQAWQMTQDMNASHILPVHWNTFIQSAEPRFEPIEWLESIVDDDRRIIITEIGQTWSTK
jgi:L-ascorbate metabolism protein UlaG (beta-lactamase superfamily)